MITYHGIGYYACLAFFPTLLALRVLPAGSAARRYVARAALTALLLIAAIVALSY
ncbi:hypothetical protein ACWCP6_17990 [Streptomyces sp. NPDC002004]